MALGDLTKQIAEQAIRNAVNPPAAPPRPDNPGVAMLAQVQAMQKALKDDEELIVLFHAGGESVRVLELYFPSWQVAVLTGIDIGIDKDKSVTRVIAAVESLQLVCKVTKAVPPATVAGGSGGYRFGLAGRRAGRAERTAEAESAPQAAPDVESVCIRGPMGTAAALAMKRYEPPTGRQTRPGDRLHCRYRLRHCQGTRRGGRAGGGEWAH